MKEPHKLDVWEVGSLTGQDGSIAPSSTLLFAPKMPIRLSREKYGLNENFNKLTIVKDCARCTCVII